MHETNDQQQELEQKLKEHDWKEQRIHEEKSDKQQ